jgi:formylglycine-generating enzyme required for sulfatase activity
VYSRPVHRVTLTRPFLLGQFPVTVAQFRAFVEATGYRTDAEQGDGSFQKVDGAWQKRGDANWRNPTFAQEDDCPVVCVSWNDAQAYLKWLNGKGGDLAFRLPTEAEWEYACRAGTEGETYDVLDAIAWYDGNSGGRTHPVAQKQPNAFGLFDMLGNAWQWCQDFYGPNDYPSGPVQDPQGASFSVNRVARGRSWGNPGTEVRSSFRNLSAPGDRYIYMGFRVAAQARTP